MAEETDFTFLHELVETARHRLSAEVWSYVVGGAGSETTVKRNRAALDAIALRPRVLRDVSRIDTTTTLLGRRLRIPVVLAPIGSLHTVTPDGQAEVIRAASAYGTISFTSSQSQPAFDIVAKASDAPKFLQLYIRQDFEQVGEVIARIKDAGYHGIALTIDSAYYGIRDRQIAAKRVAPKNQQLGREFQAKLTWKMLEQIKKWASPLPLMLKGIQTAEDARLAIEHGVDAIYVSNHGGRQLDHCQAAIDSLAEIAPEIGDAAELIIDGGFLRGTDVFKALALGAKAIAIGRPYALALAVGGSGSVVRLLEIYESELRNTMGLMGTCRIEEIGRAFVTPAQGVGHIERGWPGVHALGANVSPA